MRASLGFLLFCTAGASMLLVFFYSQNLTGSWHPSIHCFQEINSASKLMKDFLHFRNHEDKQRQQRKKEVVKTEEKPKMFRDGQKAKEILSNESDSARNEEQKTNESLPIRKNLIILSPGRGGSTLLGSLFNKNQDVMYFFEPLYFPAVKWFKIGSASQEQLKNYKTYCIPLIDSLFQCDFSNSSEKILSALASRFSRRNSMALSKLRKISNTLLGESCNSHNHTVIKILTSRVPDKTIETLKELFQKKNRYDVKMIHLVRDPRAVVYSRVQLKWVKGHLHPQFSKYVNSRCDSILQNLRLGLVSPPPWLKDRFKVIRYEDLALNTANIAKELYRFAGFDWSASVDEWISTLAKNTKKGGPYSLYKNASISIGHWKNAPEPFIRAVENNCGDLMNFLGYEKWRKQDVEN